jgi:hypothetical protein
MWDIYPSVRGLPHCKHTSSYMTAVGAEESVKWERTREGQGRTGRVRIDAKYKREGFGAPD